ncbi:DUF4184 family protein [Arsenicicoccus sp. oral taxon 190]|uniref:DUF4184 family protein n=1 Tax=Arsenicicoccus sp. oral taxon 190 TaxID=1658671 RepID=UPI00067A400C|nr:DUF4184 family protein [Arsenicicoccus sp. oral taxon 190]AKT52349.1 hypothetical protein ADJ73_15625 [Arsenicicoccus sp. oral taxon 190]
MPFTLAHPALILPLRRSPLPFAGLVCGSLVPDVPLFLPGAVVGSRDAAHAWTHTAVGLVAFCLPVGVLLTVLWSLLLAEPLLDAAPDLLRERLRTRSARHRSYWWWLLPSVAIGAVAHLGWDQITNDDSWAAGHVPWLTQDLAGHPVARWSMYLSSILGLAVVALVAWRVLGRRTPVRRPRRVPQLAPWLIPVPLLAGGAAAAYELITVGPYMGYHALAYFMLTAAIGVAGAGLVLLSVVWQLLSPLDDVAASAG